MFQGTGVIGSDSRLVQTAVIGSRNSGRAIILPTDADELAHWRRRHPRYTYWCGTQLGGCGHELSDRLCRDKVCHFAHRPHTSCHRVATGAASADHLFIKDELATWAGRYKLKGQATSRNLGSGPGDAVDYRIGQAKQHVRFQFSNLPHTEWRETRTRLSRETSTLDWVFGPGSAHPETMEELREEIGYLLRFRFETQGASRHISLRAEGARHSTEWVPLAACAMTPDGLRIPGAGSRRPHNVSRPAVRQESESTDAQGPRSREELVLLLRETLVNAARNRTRPTWQTLSRIAGVDVLRVPAAERVELLIDVERGRTDEEGPLLSALLRTEDGDPPPYVSEVIAALRYGVPATTAVLKRWCQRETERAFAVHGVTPRTAPLRLLINADGKLAMQEAERRQVIARRVDGPARQVGRQSKPSEASAEIAAALRAVRRLDAPRRAEGFLRRAEAVLARMPERYRAELREEMEATRQWLRTHKPSPRAQAGKTRQERAQATGKAGSKAKTTSGTREGGKAQPKRGGTKDRLRGARPLPGLDRSQPKRRAK
ncbi:competence protein CoiA family protein [Streptomyces sp. NPDC001222]|uniref:competence protein CoiA family protein n=1 Tax=Streptomyces sp. NPDC001222 TaxID=3364548 RepID=UPI003681933C